MRALPVQMQAFRGLFARLVPIVLFTALFIAAPFHAALAQDTAPPMGTTQSFAVLSATPDVSNTGPTIITGDVGVAPALSVIGLAVSPLLGPGTVHGAIYAGPSSLAAGAQSDNTTAYLNLAGQACTTDLTGQDLGGKTLVPGVYCFKSSAFLTGTLTLDGQSNTTAVWIFQIGSTLITAANNSSVKMINSGQDCNVFWKVGSSATIEVGTNPFIGNIFALTSITLKTGAILSGRALAQNGEVTMDSNTISASACAVAQPTLLKTFSPADIQSGANSTLTLTLSNPTGTAVTDATLTDTLPAGVFFTGSAPTTTCSTTGSISNNSGEVDLTGATIPANGSCTVTGTVTSTVVGDHINTASLNTTITASAILTVRNEIKVHILKYIDGVKATLVSADGYLFPMTSSWSASNTSGSGSYQLGNHFGSAADLYGADTGVLSVPADYSTSETTGGTSLVLPTSAACVPGSYQLVGYSESKISFLDAANQSVLSAVAFKGLTADEWVIVRNRTCPTTGTLVVTKNTSGGDGKFNFTGDLGPFSITTVGGVGKFTFNPIPTGTYTITETSQAGWTQTFTSCSPVTVKDVHVSVTNCFVTNTFIPQTSLSISKMANPKTYTQVGQVITYTYVLKNDGNVPLTGPFKVTDDKLGTFPCWSAATALAPGASVTCTMNYTIKASDLGGDAGLPTKVIANINTGPWLQTAMSTQDTTITGAGPSVPNGIYPAWCIEDHVPNDLHNQPATLYSTIGGRLPADVASVPWNEVNYVLNHKIHTKGKTTLQFHEDVQTAIWLLVGDTNTDFGVNTTAQQMINEAKANPGFTPGPGGVVAVIIHSDGIQHPPKPGSIQESIFEMKEHELQSIVNHATGSGKFGVVVVKSGEVHATVNQTE